MKAIRREMDKIKRPERIEIMSALVLVWAKENHPEKYEATVKQAKRPKTFQRYLERLVEIRVEDEPDWITQVPLDILEQTSIVKRFRLPDGSEIEVKGRRAEGDRVWGWAELGQLAERGADVCYWREVKLHLDLVIDDGQDFPSPWIDTDHPIDVVEDEDDEEEGAATTPDPKDVQESFL